MSLSTERTSVSDLIAMKGSGSLIVMATAHDYSSGRLADLAGIDAVVVGDSIAVTVLGRDTIASATLEEMILFAAATVRGARKTLVVGDLPFGSYQTSDDQAVRDAMRLVKEGGVDAVKLEGGGSSIARARAIAQAGIAVMGHLVPPNGTIWVQDDWRRTPAELAQQSYADALALQRAGCFSVMLECVPAPVAKRITQALDVPTIGFGCGPQCDGQILGLHDILGLSDEDPSPYVKRYADQAGDARSALEHYATEIRAGAFPHEGNAEPMSEDERSTFEASLERERV